MSARSPKIPVCVRLPNALYWALSEYCREIGETRTAVIKRLLRNLLKSKAVIQK